MFDIDSSELLVVAVVALLVIGPKDLPRVLRTVGHWVGRARGMARHVRAGFDTMVRESEIEELNKHWEAENKAIMASTAATFDASHWHEPALALTPPADDPVPPEPSPALAAPDSTRP